MYTQALVPPHSLCCSLWMCLEFQQGAAEMSGQSRKVNPSLSTAHTTAASAQPQGTTRPHLGERENESTPVPHPDLGESMGEREVGFLQSPGPISSR